MHTHTHIHIINTSMMSDILKPGLLSSIQEITSLIKAGLSALTLTFWRDPSSSQHHNSYSTCLWTFPWTLKLIHPTLVCSMSNSLALESWTSSQMRELLSTGAPARCPKSIQQAAWGPGRCSVSWISGRHFASLISLEQWSKTSVSGMWSLSICCSGELSAEKHCLRQRGKHCEQLDVQPSERWNVDYSVTQRGESYFLAPADDQTDTEIKWTSTEECFKTDMMCLTSSRFTNSVTSSH